MAGKKALMTKREIRAAGFVVEQHVPLGSSAETRRSPWIVRKLDSYESFGRVGTYPEALSFVREQLTSPEESSLKIYSEAFNGVRP